jgi:hypothetical protein
MVLEQALLTPSKYFSVKGVVSKERKFIYTGVVLDHAFQ